MIKGTEISFANGRNSEMEKTILRLDEPATTVLSDVSGGAGADLLILARPQGSYARTRSPGVALGRRRKRMAVARWCSLRLAGRVEGDSAAYGASAWSAAVANLADSSSIDAVSARPASNLKPSEWRQPNRSRNSVKRRLWSVARVRLG